MEKKGSQSSSMSNFKGVIRVKWGCLDSIKEINSEEVKITLREDK